MIYRIYFPFAIIISIFYSQLSSGSLNYTANDSGLIEAEQLNPKFADCKINLTGDSTELPWIANLSALPTKQSWPVVIINETLLLANGKTFRSRYADRKLRIRNTSEYEIIIAGKPYKISYIRPNPKIAPTSNCWMRIEEDIVLIHLADKIKFSEAVRPLCLPKWNNGEWEQHNKSSIIEEGTETLVSGWKCKYQYVLEEEDKLLRLPLTIKSFDECASIWETQAEYALDETIPYNFRICGTPSEFLGIGKSSSDESVDVKNDPGICTEKCYYHVWKDGANRSVLVGTFNGIAEEVTSEPTMYISLLTKDTLSWIQDNLKCGPNQYTCDNGQCIDLAGICNNVIDCDDKSDESYDYCRARNHCSPSRFECGVYSPCEPLLNEKNGNKTREKCNGVEDCRDGEDEKECDTNPKGNWFGQNWAYVVFSGIGTFFFILAVGGSIWRKITFTRAINYLTNEEIVQFRQGGENIFGFIEWEDAAGPITNRKDSIQLSSMQMPYIYDLEKDKIKFGEEIGRGAFGKVFKGTVEGSVVAIKVLNTKEKIDKEMFKTFLFELKIMAYVNFILEGHPNIIKLVGAYTDDIRNLELFIAVEYCHFGSIADYLKKNRNIFQDAAFVGGGVGVGVQGRTTAIEVELPLPESSRATTTGYNCSEAGLPVSYISAAQLQNFNIADLNKWTKQIVEGMCFLASHKIVHGDLAARNILLDCNLTAKISDFGLSRQIYYYNLSCANVDKNTRLPWAYMAPEVIGNMKISTKSDVWSFGVTMWELYTLGAVPYGGLEWSPSFVDQLKCGLRLTKPQFATKQLFTIIQNCWKFHTSSRPTFRTLREMLLKVMLDDPAPAPAPLEQEQPQQATSSSSSSSLQQQRTNSSPHVTVTDSSMD